MNCKEVRSMEKSDLVIECPHCNKAIALQIKKAESEETERVPLIEMVQTTVKRWNDDLEILEEDDSVVVIPKAYLGKDVWQQINDSLKPFDPEWVSAGKESRWVIRERTA
jgi:hypothetical protein